MFKCLGHLIKRFTRTILLLRRVSYIFRTSLKFWVKCLTKFENIAKTLFMTLEVSLRIVKIGGKSGVGIKMIKSDNFQYFSIKSYVVDVYKRTNVFLDKSQLQSGLRIRIRRAGVRAPLWSPCCVLEQDIPPPPPSKKYW